MKLWEINLNISTEYKISFGVNRFNVICKDGDLYKQTSTGLGLKKFTDEYSLDFIVNNCEFGILWDKIERDTKVVCSNYQCTMTRNAHFFKYEKETDSVFVYENGRTSHTSRDRYEQYESKYVKLY